MSASRFPNLSRGKTLFVDATLGSNTTGLRQSSLPFQTLTAAKNAAVSGDLIVVRPGVYTEGNLLKNGVNWHFEAGATVTAATTAGIFDDSSFGANAAIVCSISGAGNFIGTAGCSPVRIANVSSVIYMDASTVQSATGITLDLRTGSLYLCAKRIICTGYDAIGVQGGTHYIDALFISAADDALTTEGLSLSGRTYVKAHTVTAGTIFNAEGFGEIWLDCMRAVATVDPILSSVAAADNAKFVMICLEFSSAIGIPLGAIRSRFIGTRFVCPAISLEGNAATLQNCTIIASGTNSLVVNVGTTLQVQGTCQTNKAAGAGVVFLVGALSVDSDVS